MASIEQHPGWCERRLHALGDHKDHERELFHLDITGAPGHGDGCVEVQLVQTVAGEAKIVLYVSECDGSEPDDVECIYGDGNAAELTADQARQVVAQLSRALSLLSDTGATVDASRVPPRVTAQPASLVRAA